MRAGLQGHYMYQSIQENRELNVLSKKGYLLAAAKAEGACDVDASASGAVSDSALLPF